MYKNSQDVLLCITFLYGITLAVEFKNVTSRPNLAEELELGSDINIAKYFDWDSLSKGSSVVVTTVTCENYNFSSQDRDVFDAGKIQISTRHISKNSVTFFGDGNSAKITQNKQEISKTIHIIILSDLPFSEASNLTKIILKNIVKLKLGPILVVFPKMSQFDLRLETLGLNSKDGSLLELSLDLDLYMIFPTEIETRNEIRFKLYELYSIKDTDYFLQVPVSNNQINFQTLSQKVVRRSGFNGAVIVAVADVTPIHELEASITWDKDGVIKFRDGTAVSVYWDLRDMLNFTEEALIGSYIGVAPGGQVFGKSYDLIESGKADLSISQITITDSRAIALQFLQPTANSNIVHAFFKQPALNTMRNFFAAPFSTTLWISIWSMWIVIIAVMMLMSWIKTKANRIQYDLVVQSKNRKVCGPLPGPAPAPTTATPSTPEGAAPAIQETITGNLGEGKDLIAELTTTMENDLKIDKAFLYDSYIWGIGAMCNQGWTVAPSWASLSMRIVFFCGSVTGLMIYVYYSATIVSVLSVKIAPIETFEDLLAYKYILYVHELSGTLKAFFLNSVKPHYNLSQPVVTASTAREVEMMLDSSSSFLSYPDVFYTGALTELNYTAGFLCTELDSVPAHLHPTSGAMFVRPGSPFREIFNYKILMMRERGFINRNNRNYNFKTVPKCDTSTKGKVHHLGIHTVYIAFCITFVGHGISTVGLAGEMFMKSRKI